MIEVPVSRTQCVTLQTTHTGRTEEWLHIGPVTYEGERRVRGVTVASRGRGVAAYLYPREGHRTRIRASARGSCGGRRSSTGPTGR